LGLACFLQGIIPFYFLLSYSHAVRIIDKK